MIDPTAADIGRLVIYRRGEYYGEEGQITDFNDTYVFVRYADDRHSKATRYQDLEWVA